MKPHMKQRLPRSAPGADGRPTNPFEPFPRAALDSSIPARFESMAGRWPERLAVKMGDDAWTYRELGRASHRVAHAVLDRLGPGNEPVVVLLPQGLSQIAAVLGALEAGKIYVPLDPAHPPARLTDAIVDTGARLVLTSTAHLELTRRVCAGAATLPIDSLGEDLPDDAPGLGVEPDAGAYIFYTSGSTGRPKGVLDTHRNVLHNVMRYTNTLHLGADDRLTLLQGLSGRICGGGHSTAFGALGVYPGVKKGPMAETLDCALARSRRQYRLHRCLAMG